MSNLDIALENPPDFLFICTQDSEIARVCEHLSAYGNRLHATQIIHCSGALSLEPLSSLITYGCRIGSMHPLQAFPHPKAQQAFFNCPIAIEGDDDVANMLLEFAEQLGAKPFRLHLGAKAKYHAAACIASNYLVTLAHISTALFEEAGVSASQSRALSQALMRSSFEHISTKPNFQSALSGPIQRGETQTIEKHIKSLADSVYAKVYTELGKHTLALTKHSAQKKREILEAIQHKDTLGIALTSCEIEKV